jgi:HEAT repeat protein
VKRMGAIRRAARSGDPQSLPGLTRCLGDRNSLIRIEAIKAVDLLTPEQESLEQLLLPMLTDPHPRVVQRALATLSERGELTVSVLHDVLDAQRQRKDGYHLMLRIDARDAIGALGDPDGTPLLLFEYGTMEDAQFRDAIVRSLGFTGGEAAEACVEGHLQRLLSEEPKEKIALGPWRESVRIARASLARLQTTR